MNTHLVISDEILSATEITYKVGDIAHVETLNMAKINNTAECPDIKLELINLESLAPLDNTLFIFDNYKNEIKIETNDE